MSQNCGWRVPAQREDATAIAAELPPCRVGMHDERVGLLNYGAKILAFDARKGAYRVKDDRSGLEDWVTAYSLRAS